MPIKNMNVADIETQATPDSIGEYIREIRAGDHNANVAGVIERLAACNLHLLNVNLDEALRHEVMDIKYLASKLPNDRTGVRHYFVNLVKPGFERCIEQIMLGGPDNYSLSQFLILNEELQAAILAEQNALRAAGNARRPAEDSSPDGSDEPAPKRIRPMPRF